MARQYLAKNKWVFTEKIDGTNVRVQFENSTVVFSGRTDNSQLPSFLVQKLMNLFPVDKLNSVFPSGNVCLYGEGYGAKIQKGGGNYIKDGCGFILFDVLCGEFWLERNNVEDVASKLNIPVVPVVGYGELIEAVEMVRLGFDSLVGNCIAEGLVMRPNLELRDRNNDRIISKIKHKDFIFFNKHGTSCAKESDKKKNV